MIISVFCKSCESICDPEITPVLYHLENQNKKNFTFSVQFTNSLQNAEINIAWINVSVHYIVKLPAFYATRHFAVYEISLSTTGKLSTLQSGFFENLWDIDSSNWLQKYLAALKDRQLTTSNDSKSKQVSKKLKESRYKESDRNKKKRTTYGQFACCR